MLVPVFILKRANYQDADLRDNSNPLGRNYGRWADVLTHTFFGIKFPLYAKWNDGKFIMRLLENLKDADAVFTLSDGERAISVDIISDNANVPQKIKINQDDPFTPSEVSFFYYNSKIKDIIFRIRGGDIVFLVTNSDCVFINNDMYRDFLKLTDEEFSKGLSLDMWQQQP